MAGIALEKAEPPKKPSGWQLLKAALRNRKMGIMLSFGFAAGLPYALLLGTLYAWLGEAKVDLETMGVFSLIGLAYAFKFLWSPIVDRVALPGLHHLGRRRSWLVPIQLLLGTSFIVMSQLDPKSALGWFSLLAGLGAFASATQDIVIDAWRVDVADETATLEILSSIYQLGYRFAALAGGALALVLAERVGWPNVYLGMGICMLAVLLATWAAPDTDRPADAASVETLSQAGELSLRVRAWAIGIVGAGWIWALFTVIAFMVRSLGAEPADRPDSTEFIKLYGPLVVVATVIIPAIVAAVLNYWKASGRYVLTQSEPVRLGIHRFVDHAYGALLMPLAEIIGRLGWASILALSIILSYRFTDAVWGPFALPFYLEELKYSKDEVAIASKFFGVGMTMLGIAAGAVSFAMLGRMATLVFGAVVAAASNLLYADLAQGGAMLDVAGQYSGFYHVASWLGSDDRFSRLLLTIAGENLAGGIAGAAFVAYLSTITSRAYSAVQYALLSSLTFLIGSLGRGALGEMIETQGYAHVFYLTASLGLIAVVLCLIEWARVGRREQTP